MELLQEQFKQTESFNEKGLIDLITEDDHSHDILVKDLEAKKLQEQQDKQNLQEIHNKLGIDKQNKENLFFENLKRPYGVDDIKNLQQALIEFEEKRKSENGEYIFDYSNFYRFLVSFQKKEVRQAPLNEKKIPVDNYQELELGIFNGWKQNLLKNENQVLKQRPRLAKVVNILQKESSPKNLDELRDLYRRYPLINEMSAVSYQEGVGEKTDKRSGFLHINMSRFNAYKYELPKADTRIYLNPPVEAIPKLSMHLVALAEKEKIPLYFKIIDYSFQKFTPENAGRLDKMLIYTDKENAPKLTKIIKELQTKKPDWFNGRELPNLVAPISEGVGIAAEPSDFQKQKFEKQGVSFNSVRALFLKEIWQDTTRDILLIHKDKKPRGGRTCQHIFNDHFKLSFKLKRLNNETLDNYIKQAWQSDLNPDNLNQESKNKIGEYIKEALLRTMQDIIPNITPESLSTWTNKKIQEKARQYGIDPENIALNK